MKAGSDVEGFWHTIEYSTTYVSTHHSQCYHGAHTVTHQSSFTNISYTLAISVHPVVAKRKAVEAQDLQPARRWQENRIWGEEQGHILLLGKGLFVGTVFAGA